MTNNTTTVDQIAEAVINLIEKDNREIYNTWHNAAKETAQADPLIKKVERILAPYSKQHEEARKEKGIRGNDFKYAIDNIVSGLVELQPDKPKVSTYLSYNVKEDIRGRIALLQENKTLANYADLESLRDYITTVVKIND